MTNKVFNAVDDGLTPHEDAVDNLKTIAAHVRWPECAAVHSVGYLNFTVKVKGYAFEVSADSTVEEVQATVDLLTNLPEGVLVVAGLVRSVTLERAGETRPLTVNVEDLRIWPLELCFEKQPPRILVDLDYGTIASDRSRLPPVGEEVILRLKPIDDDSFSRYEILDYELVEAKQQGS